MGVNNPVKAVELVGTSVPAFLILILCQQYTVIRHKGIISYTLYHLHGIEVIRYQSLRQRVLGGILNRGTVMRLFTVKPYDKSGIGPGQRLHCPRCDTGHCQSRFSQPFPAQLYYLLFFYKTINHPVAQHQSRRHGCPHGWRHHPPHMGSTGTVKAAPVHHIPGACADPTIRLNIRVIGIIAYPESKVSQLMCYGTRIFPLPYG